MRPLYTLLFTIAAIFSLSAQLIITEISYNPPEAGIDSLEYIEIYNAGAASYDLTGTSFVGFEYIFGNDSIDAEAYICIAVNAQAMQNVFGKTCFQWISGGLKNSGELVQINDANGIELDAVTYGTSAPWPSSSDGTNGNGASIVLCDVTSDNSDPANWSAAKNNIGYQIDGKEVKGSPADSNTISCEVVPDFTIEAMPNNTFAPNDITIDPGQTVRWKNKGGFHNLNGEKSVYPNNPESFSNGAASTQPWTFDFTFFNEGVYNYQCDPHAGIGMKGKITVGVPKTYPKYAIGKIITENADGIADSINTTCEITGTVHGVNVSTSTGLLFWVIDDSHDGISVFNLNNTLGYTVKEGDKITLKGTVGQYKGLTQFNADVINVAGTGTLRTPIVTTSLSEANESKLVKFENMTFVDASFWRGDGSSFNIDVTNGTQTETMRITEFTDLANAAAPTPPFNLIGLVNQFDNDAPLTDSYQLMPRSIADIMEISSVKDNVLVNVGIHPNPSQNQVEITGVNQPDEVCLYHMNGQLLKVWNHPGNKITINHQNGLYILSIRKDNAIAYKKIEIIK